MTDETVLEENANNDLQNTVVSEAEAPTANENTDVEKVENTAHEIDYVALIEEDLRALRGEFGELAELSDITELDNPLRYAELRDLGLSPSEAYLATRRRRSDNRSHLRSIHSIKATHGSSMSDSELASARELFGDISDAEIRKLYKKVTK